MNGKGDAPRPLGISREEWEERWTSIKWERDETYTSGGETDEGEWVNEDKEDND